MATLRRTTALTALLPLLTAEALEVERAGSATVEVVVCDNDPEQSARPVVAALAGNGPIRVRYVAEPCPGLAAVRNRLLRESGAARLLACIDDDERPESPWLQPLLDTWAACGRPALVSGRVRVEAPDGLEPWLTAGGFFRRRSLPTGTPIAVASTNNLLLDLDQLRAEDLTFDPAFGTSGGEDTLLSTTLHRRGRMLVWCDESVVVDVLPAERTTRAWVLRRARSHGNVQGRVALRLAEGPGRRRVRLRLLVSGVARVLLGQLWRPVADARGRRLSARGAGLAGAALGQVTRPYAPDPPPPTGPGGRARRVGPR